MSATSQTAARTVTTIAEVREQLRAARALGRTVALVPTMGALHDGHLSLIERAGAEADVVVVSVFVNPTQFDDAGDLAAYPRDPARDAGLAAAAGAELVFGPSAAEIYPHGFASEVRVTGPLTETLEGAHRGSGHFHGVTTVVTKLLNIVQPDVAVFGAKDAQQLLVIERLVRDLDIPTRIVPSATVREPDGLALSSRNVRLDPAARAQATAISRALSAGARSTTPVATAARALAEHAIEPEYVALRDARTFTELPDTPPATDALLLVAATVGSVRLIDNLPIPTTQRP